LKHQRARRASKRRQNLKMPNIPAIRHNDLVRLESKVRFGATNWQLSGQDARP
jgi:hypothetical protein